MCMCNGYMCVYVYVCMCNGYIVYVCMCNGYMCVYVYVGDRVHVPLCHQGTAHSRPHPRVCCVCTTGQE